jgi:sterol desaturase/sphingolipid hydroxylase (fatty acid hydroxylase superfamily)
MPTTFVSPAPPVAARPAGFAAWLAFPTLLTAVGAATISLLSTRLPRPLISGAVTLAALAVILLLERLAPLHRSWNARPDRLDVALLLGNRIVDVALIAAVLGLVGLLERAGLGRTLLHLWPGHAPLLLQAALGITLAEIVRYGLHRLSHRPGLLGHVHRIHHQPQRMYALNGPRLHPANQLWISIANAVPMLLLGAPLDAVVLAAIITTVFVLFQHANVHLRFDGWNRVFATPDVHRLHHLRGGQAVNRGVNYGIVLLLPDILGGTYRPALQAPAVDAIGDAAPV